MLSKSKENADKKSLGSDMHKTPLLIVVSAPSGGGKTTLCRRLLHDFDDIVYSVSCTTRPPRGNEKHGKDYFFVSTEEFGDLVAKKLLLEHACVHGHRYGTRKDTVIGSLESGQSVLLDIDVQGARQIRNHISREGDQILKNAFVDIFITVSNINVLKERLAKRAEDSADSIKMRTANALNEMERKREFMYVVINDDLEDAYSDLLRILSIRWQGRNLVEGGNI